MTGPVITHDALIENRNCTTVGRHNGCPSARFVGGTSRYICECKTPAVLQLLMRAPTGFTAPDPLPVVDGI